ncbi:PLP-dependent aminotransferase family protein [Bacillus gobiensis]|uniref:aminotransferase-like domain-containing protein n=1 Tax=Bacillus gobiensis TaxID=1441095 RepID=UPI003D22C536
MTDQEWKIDRYSGIPLHKQIEDFIKRKIIHGEWTGGTKLPSQRALAARFQVNRSTVVEAMGELYAQGLVEGKTGGSTKVCNNTWSLLSAYASLDWNSYVKKGSYHPNISIIQKINREEFNEEIIRLGTGELSKDLLPVSQMESVIKKMSFSKVALGYEEPKGNIILRQTVSKHLERYDIQASPSNILIVSGALQALQLVSFGLLKKGSIVLAESPSYLHSIKVFQSGGTQVIGVPMDKDGVKTSLLSQYKQQLSADLLYTIPSFHNPTGITMSEARRKELQKLCREEQLPMIEDDVYRDLWLDDPPPPPLKSKDKEGNILYVGSLSKTASPGLRVGWIIGPEPVIERLADIKMQTDYGTSALSQSIAAEWLSEGYYDEHLKVIRSALKRRREKALQLLQTYFGGSAHWTIPAGGFYIWITFPKEIRVHELFEKALKRNVLINPGNIYDPAASSCIRFSYAYSSMQDLEKGIKVLAEIMEELGGSR